MPYCHMYPLHSTRADTQTQPRDALRYAFHISDAVNRLRALAPALDYSPLLDAVANLARVSDGQLEKTEL